MLIDDFNVLIDSPEILKRCAGYSDFQVLMSALVDQLKRPGLEPDQLYEEILKGNSRSIEPDINQFRHHWYPAGYSQNGEINWRIKIAELPFAPFYDDRVSQLTCRSLLATLIKPKLKLDYLLKHFNEFEEAAPAGFIFHLSRCGSTLLANGLSATGRFSVLSEASFLTDLLLDSSLGFQDKVRALRMLLSLFNPSPVIKLNAWDIVYFSLIREAFPTTPIVFVIREPLEILASHKRLTGIHMVPGTKVAHCLGQPATDSLLEYQAAVLQQLMCLMFEHRSRGSPEYIRVIDYRQIDLEALERIAEFFGAKIPAMQMLDVSLMLQKNSKAPDDAFCPYAHNIVQNFDSNEIDKVADRLVPHYQKLKLSFVDFNTQKVSIAGYPAM
ncbi:hypothetical protein BTA51_23640 [Hahella sp. CCB-MM4]|uniref:hypothetical protein n=1 Tax=Hahella sp. (strain CCB-MM4) TaxID=1926491 RepID=UPI000B9A2AE9|nr:hypothetical protein [Hahella sp. CCB-MM4]OZG70835.1 hypothetical protein BTA51_23640 [Hahella sp. CCB-MM4]